MKFEYKNNEYELMEMNEPHKNETFGIIGIFKVKYVVIENNEKIEVSKNEKYDFEDYEYINYFCNQEDIEENIESAKYYIDEWIAHNIKTKYTLTQALELLQQHFEIDESFMEPGSKKKWMDCIESLKGIASL